MGIIGDFMKYETVIIQGNKPYYSNPKIEEEVNSLIGKNKNVASIVFALGELGFEVQGNAVDGLARYVLQRKVD